MRKATARKRENERSKLRIFSCVIAAHHVAALVTVRGRSFPTASAVTSATKTTSPLPRHWRSVSRRGVGAGDARTAGGRRVIDGPHMHSRDYAFEVYARSRAKRDRRKREGAGAPEE
jgi:hypothetical protein